MKRVVVARYKEDVTWIDRIPKDWITEVVQKKTEELEGDTPNRGREATSFLFSIIKHYDEIRPNDTWAFLQGDPFAHAGDVIGQLRAVKQYTPFKGGPDINVHYLQEGRTVRYSLPLRCDELGNPHHPGVPVAACYERWIKKPFPKDGVTFYPGGQFMVSGKDILNRGKAFYKSLYEEILNGDEILPYVTERLWGSIFT